MLILLCTWLLITSLTFDVHGKDQVLFQQYYNSLNKSYVDTSWNEYVAEIYNNDISSLQVQANQVKTNNDIYDKSVIQMYYKNAKIKIQPLNWKSKSLYSTIHGKFDKAPGRYRAGFISVYTVPSYSWIEVHRFSTHLLYGKDKVEGYSDVSHTTGKSVAVTLHNYPFASFIMHMHHSIISYTINVGLKYDGPIPRLKAAFGCWFWASKGVFCYAE